MITCLHIENIAVIEKVNVDLSRGFVVLTGQTGAGKTVLINSLQMILGQRLSGDIIRSGCDSASVSAVFSFNESKAEVQKLCEDVGVDYSDEMILRRAIYADGRSRAFINGAPVTLSVLKQIGERLVNIHGQHDNHALMNSENHYNFLDNFAKNEKEYTQYTNTYKEYLKIRTEYNAIEIEDKNKEARTELLRFEIDEIESAMLEDGEEERLLDRRKALMNFEKIKSALNSAYSLTNSESEADDCLRRTKNALLSISDLGQEYESLSDLAENAYDVLSELSHHVSDISRGLEYDREELDNIEQRLDLISSLKRKYGNTIAEVLVYLSNSKNELEKSENAEKRKNDLTQALIEIKEKVISTGKKLTQTRLSASKRLEKEIISQLAFLDMPKVNFTVLCEHTKPSSTGCDNVEFLISTNLGQETRSLAKTASGGELSRIMLSIKSVLSDCDSVETLIFDEIDTGVSGGTAEKIAKKMKLMSKNKQVLCVTHLAQIAAYADEHLLIGKTDDGKTTTTFVRNLSEDERVSEIARIMSGEKTTDTFLASAKELIDNALS